VGQQRKTETMNQLTSILNQLTPFIRFVALLFGVLAAYGALCEVLPVLRQIVSPKGNYQNFAIVAAALAIVAGNR
jgi:hypothetical protein